MGLIICVHPTREAGFRLYVHGYEVIMVLGVRQSYGVDLFEDIQDCSVLLCGLRFRVTEDRRAFCAIIVVHGNVSAGRQYAASDQDRAKDGVLHVNLRREAIGLGGPLLIYDVIAARVTFKGFVFMTCVLGIRFKRVNELVHAVGIRVFDRIGYLIVYRPRVLFCERVRSAGNLGRVTYFLVKIVSSGIANGVLLQDLDLALKVGSSCVVCHLEEGDCVVEGVGLLAVLRFDNGGILYARLNQVGRDIRSNLAIDSTCTRNIGRVGLVISNAGHGTAVRRQGSYVKDRVDVFQVSTVGG